MPGTLSGTSIEVDSTGAVVAWTTQKYVYLKPTRDDFLFNRAASGSWIPWVGDPDLDGGAYDGAIAAAVNLSTGGWSLTVPYSDTEIQLSGAAGPGTPALNWQIIDPNVTSGLKVYSGPTLAAVIGASKTLRELLALAAPDTWTIHSASFTGYPYGTERLASVSFAAGVSSAAATWADIGSSTWKTTGSLRTDDTGITGWKILTGSETATGCTVELSAAPGSGKTARVDLWVRP